MGGSVRDALMGRLGNDLDFTTSARPDEIEALVRKVTKAVWDVGRAFGTIACRITEADGTEWLVEITTFRADSYDDHTRKPEVAFGDHLGGDLVRRDFTVNAMALDAVDGELLDPFGGLGDLHAEVIRTPAAPELSFSDDPLRMMRAARFTSQLGFRAGARRGRGDDRDGRRGSRSSRPSGSATSWSSCCSPTTRVRA